MTTDEKALLILFRFKVAQLKLQARQARLEDRSRTTSRQVSKQTNSYLPMVADTLNSNAAAPFPPRLRLLDTSYRQREVSLPIEIS